MTANFGGNFAVNGVPATSTSPGVRESELLEGHFASGTHDRIWVPQAFSVAFHTRENQVPQGW